MTVGTTRFDGLVKYLDSNFLDSDLNFTFQIADGLYIPLNYNYFKFNSQIDNYYDSADVVVTHAGAGSIYRLLETNKRMVIVPNVERRDAHQLDISRYMHKNNYAISVEKFEDILSAIEFAATASFKRFNKERFFKAGEILSYLIDDFC